MLASPPARVRTRDDRTDLPSQHAKSWRGVGRLPSRLLFTREQYRDWMARGMVPRGYVLGYERDGGYFFAVEPPRAVVQEEPESGPPPAPGPMELRPEEPVHPADAGEEE